MFFPGLKSPVQEKTVRMELMGKLARLALLELLEKMETATIRIAKEQVVREGAVLGVTVVLVAMVLLQLPLVVRRVMKAKMATTLPIPGLAVVAAAGAVADKKTMMAELAESLVRITVAKVKTV